ncbi:MAG: type II toxin-antitoxin system VapC family toxin [Acidobacteria bacterium]|nr:type II toxin-antitoxin system VapC family toxin [Acidobacteriota bacterium]
MSYLVDTNLLLRSAQPSHPMHADATRAVGQFLAGGEILSVIPQNIIEYWAVATRPVAANGLGLSVEETAVEVARLKSIFRILTDNAAIFSEWEGLVGKDGVKGKEVHDARIVAAMLAHGVTRLLTFNTDDFKRYTQITAINPVDV